MNANMGTNSTNSNVAWQLQTSDTGGHETNRSGECEDESRGFSVAEKGCREKVAGCCDDEFWDCAGIGKDFSSGSSPAEEQELKLLNEGDRSAIGNEGMTSKGLDLAASFGSVDDYLVLKGAGGRIQKLWESYCGLHLRIGKLEAELNEIHQKLLQECPSFFETRYSLVGQCSFPFRPELKAARKSNVKVAARNAIILRASSLTAYKICWRLDFYGFPLLEKWKKKFPGIKTWVAAYRYKACKPLVDKLISEAKARGRLL
jgi:hypothetical protein